MVRLREDCGNKLDHCSRSLFVGGLLAVLQVGEVRHCYVTAVNNGYAGDLPRVVSVDVRSP